MAEFVSGSEVTLLYKKESVVGQAPTGEYKKYRNTSETLKFSVETTESEETNEYRATADVLRVGAKCEGSVESEFIFGEYDEFLEAVLQSNFVETPASSGIFVLKNGSVKQSFTIQKKLKSDAFMLFKGMFASSMSLNLTSKEKITQSVTFLGMAHETATSSAATTVAASTTNEVLTATANSSPISINSDSGAFAKSLSLEINNNSRERDAVGVLGLVGVGFGNFAVTGTTSVYFKDFVLYNKYVGGEPVEISFEITDSKGNKYAFLMPKVKFTDVTVANGGKDTDIMKELSYSALYDENGVVLKITKTPAPVGP